MGVLDRRFINDLMRRVDKYIMTNDNCIFCKIINGQEPACFLYRDEFCSAFLDIQPVNPGHTLVIPNLHCESFLDLSPEISGRLINIAQIIAGALGNSSIRCEGINLVLADGEAAGQEVFHTNLHIIPRNQGDGFGFRFGNRYFNRPSRDELERVAEIIRKGL